MKRGAGRHFASDGKCPGEPEEISYMIPRVPEPLPVSSGDGTNELDRLVSVLRVSVIVTPALHHIGRPNETSTRAERVMRLEASHAEQLAVMIGIHGPAMASALGEMIAPHPRPNPHDGWLR